MEHLNVSLGSFMPADPEKFTDSEYFPSDALVRQAGVGRGNISFGVVKEVTSYGRTAAIKNFVKNLACNLGVANKVKFIEDFQCPGAGTIGTLLEQFPSPEGSRVSLSQERDALGMRKAVVRWVLTPQDEKTVRVLGQEMAKGFAAAGLGFVKLNDFILDERKPVQVGHHCHHMGTTRMAENERWGVVDRNSQVFGVSNLFVAGASVFPTGGGGNPTMPLLQLTLRLGEHLLKT
jgi:choline dehydrogenase-like flavoprotein